MKQRQQKELAENIIAKVTKELENPKVLQQILQQSVADVESKPPLPAVTTSAIGNVLSDMPFANAPVPFSRNRLLQGPIDHPT